MPSPVVIDPEAPSEVRLSRLAARTHRVLVVDDNAKIHEDFEKILGPRPAPHALDAAEAALFGTPEPVPERPSFTLDCMLGGEQALALVKRSLDESAPFCIAFVDVRMPAGWDGVKTTRELWRVDPRIQVVLCTAYSDYTWEDLATQLGRGDNFLVLKKPFDTIEVRQVASSLMQKWELLREKESRVRDLEKTVLARTAELARANEQLREEMAHRTKAEAELRRVHKLEALGRLAAGVAHEINNPLSFILGNLELSTVELQKRIRGEPSTPLPDLCRSLDDAALGAERIRRIVRDIRTLSRPHEEGRSEVDVHESLAAVLRMLKADPRFSATVESELGPIPPVLAERHGFEQVLTNVLVNASQALRGGDERPPIRVSTRVAATGVVIEIRDAGKGIPEQELEKVFDPFFTTRALGEGTGLGLSICRTIMESFEGRVELESRVGVGTAVRLLLRAAPPRAAVMEVPPSVKPAPAHLARVLIVDDEKALLRSLSRLLAPRLTTVSASGREALELYRNGTFDVVLCDLMMPEMTGVQLLAEIAKLGPEHARRVVLMTGGTLGSVAGATSEVSCRWLEKPVKTAELRRVVDEIAAQSIARAG